MRASVSFLKYSYEGISSLLRSPTEMLVQSGSESALLHVISLVANLRALNCIVSMLSLPVIFELRTKHLLLVPCKVNGLHTTDLLYRSIS